MAYSANPPLLITGLAAAAAAVLILSTWSPSPDDDTDTMDTYFVSHGAPTLTFDERKPARKFLLSWREMVMPRRTPKAILMVSAHWDTSEPAVNVISGNSDTIHDFYGFPKFMYQLKYPAPGAPELAKRVKALLENASIGRVTEDHRRGLDHGAWVPLTLMYPKANIPVCQLSVQSKKDGAYHYNMGKALAPLRRQGVLIIGSGSATHNLRKFDEDNDPPHKWALDFDTWLTDSLLNGRFEDVNNFYEKAPNSKTAHPWPEHFYPLNVALGAAGQGAKTELIHRSWSHGTMSYSSYRFKCRT